MRRANGFSLLELVFTIAIFGMFLMMLVTLTAEMRGQEKRYPVNFMRHPQVMAMLARLRRDVLDATFYSVKNDPYPAVAGNGKYTQGPKVLIVSTMVPGSGRQDVVWDFRVPGEVQRISYNVGVSTTWIARGLPRDFGATIDAVEVPGHPYGVRIQAKDSKGRLALDQYYQPRAHE